MRTIRLNAQDATRIALEIATAAKEAVDHQAIQPVIIPELQVKLHVGEKIIPSDPTQLHMFEGILEL